MLKNRLFFQAAGQAGDDGVVLAAAFSWGGNGAGQTGQGTDAGSTMVPTQMGIDTDWISVSAGSNTSFAIKKNGTMWGTGSPNNGRLGIGAVVVDQVVLVQIGTDTDWDQVAGGSVCGFAIKKNRAMYSWGQNTNGRTGQGTTSGNILVPTQIGTDTDWVSVSCVTQHCVAIKENGTLWVWGLNANSQLGLNDTTDRLVPTQVGSDTDWLQAKACAAHSVALKNNGSIWSAGDNNAGRSAQGTAVGNTPVFTQIGTDTDWVFVARGNAQVFAIKENKTLWGAGSNNFYQLGLNDTTNRLSLVQIGTDTDWSFAFTGTSYSGFIKENGQLWVCGNNSNFQTGLGTEVGLAQTPTQNGVATGWQEVQPSPTSGHAIARRVI